MKKLRDLTNIDKINVSELMSLKGGVIPSVPKGCETTACHDHACSGSSCTNQSCSTGTCVTNS